MFGLSPNLETLVMTKSSSSSFWGCWKNEIDCDNAEHYWTAQKRIFKCLSPHLEEVVFVDLSWFHDESNFFSFVQFLLKMQRCCKRLLKMSMLGDALPKEFFVAANKLLTFPRSSPDAAVMFCK
ncbi:uncharacterized protein LOC131313569 [Rhododendron vialii]|uniref:uncharacterized protein LOC131313569 n=1 Tax=Rhododendron vialii TaxID=182163 RepID=UPI00265EE75B|nr:uncharacterized protein LOC131313569 [Rhododendron vialii]